MKIVKKYLGLELGIISLILFQILSKFPHLVEYFFTESIYRGIRYFYGITLYYIPFPLIYLFLALIFFFIIRHILRRINKKNKAPSIAFMLNLLGWIVVIFYWAWGFNYARQDFRVRINLEDVQPDENFLYDELISVDNILEELRTEMNGIDSIPLGIHLLPIDYQNEINRVQKEVLKTLGEPYYSKIYIRNLKPSGILLRIKTAGVYFPFAFEGQIDNGLHHIEKPYVMAHEMAHANAFTDEGVCNFIGFYTCIHADDPFIQYSGWLEYQGYLFRSLRKNHADLLKEKGYKLPVFVRTDINAIVNQLKKYPDIFPKFRDLFYDNYLKAQGVKAGMMSYGQFVQLAYSFQDKYGKFSKD